MSFWIERIYTLNSCKQDKNRILSKNNIFHNNRSLIYFYPSNLISFPERKQQPVILEKFKYVQYSNIQSSYRCKVITDHYWLSIPLHRKAISQRSASSFRGSFRRNRCNGGTRIATVQSGEEKATYFAGWVIISLESSKRVVEAGSGVVAALVSRRRLPTRHPV